MGDLSRISTACRVYLGLVGFSLLGSLASALFRLDPGPIRPLTGALTLLLGVAVLLGLLAKQWGWRKTLSVSTSILVLGAASEICGIYTGFPFGKYTYTDQWWPTVTLPGGHFFPLLLPFAWFMMVCGGYLAFAATLTRVTAVVLGAVVVTLINLPMEWAMLNGLRYWTWLDPDWPIGDVGFGVPVMNSVGWLLTSVTAGMVLSAAGGGDVEDSKDPLWVLLGNLVLMLGLGTIGATLGTPLPPVR